MKQYLSALSLAVRATIYKVSGVIFLMGACQYLLFSRSLASAEATWSQYSQQFASLEELISNSRAPLLFYIGFLAVCAILCLNGTEFWGSRSGYTIQRLSISEKKLHIAWAIYYSLCFFLFLCLQLAVTYGLGMIYMASPLGKMSGNQTLFLAFYRSPFLHSLLPLAETSRAIRNVILCIALGISASSFSYLQRRDRKYGTMIAFSVIAAVSFQQEMGHFSIDMLVSIISIYTAGKSIYNMRGDGNDV
ncbi:MAG: hypothetical protein VB078_09415 [Clostridiaceae bacterium]|nr:hypothetical protein [Clostridiaceae bacterium]